MKGRGREGGGREGGRERGREGGHWVARSPHKCHGLTAHDWDTQYTTGIL